ncbi:hypothetical protein TNCV_2652011 [Trichonephila clavipes]|nr:hypothetical protein TNCV_2652011 [Trichonephila clavipes]
MVLRWSTPHDPFPVRELVTSQRSRSFELENIPDWTIRRLCSKSCVVLSCLFYVGVVFSTRLNECEFTEPSLYSSLNDCPKLIDSIQQNGLSSNP